MIRNGGHGVTRIVGDGKEAVSAWSVIGGRLRLVWQAVTESLGWMHGEGWFHKDAW